MKKQCLIMALIMGLSGILSAETHLSDDIGDRTLDAAGNPYIIDKDVTIPANTQLTLKQGCLFLFHSFTGMNVYGSLIVEGTTENPIVFTSINDANYNPSAQQLPNAFDWNGIIISESAGSVKLRNFRLMFSVFGIKAKKDDIVIQNGNFKQNGQFHFTINDKIHYVMDNISYSYNAETAEKGPAPIEAGAPAPKKPRSAGTEKSGGGSKRKAAAITLLSVGTATAISSVITGIMAVQYGNKANNAKTPGEYDDYIGKFSGMRTAAIITGVVAGVTIPASLFLFVNNEKTTTIRKVSVHLECGIDNVGFSLAKRF